MIFRIYIFGTYSKYLTHLFECVFRIQNESILYISIGYIYERILFPRFRDISKYCACVYVFFFLPRKEILLFKMIIYRNFVRLVPIRSRIRRCKCALQLYIFQIRKTIDLRKIPRMTKMSKAYII